MKKIFNKFTKYLLLVVMIFSDLMTPIRVLADETATKPQKGDVGINETVSSEGTVTVSKGSLVNEGDVEVTKTVRKGESDGKFVVEFDVKGKDVTTTTTTSKPIYAVVVFDRSSSMHRNECIFWFFGCREVKFSSAVDGAKTFANSLLRNFSNANLALIGFSTNVNTIRGFANANFDNVNFGSPNGVTNMTGALNGAKTLLDGIGDDYTKYIVVISDGAPTDSNGYETTAAANEAIATANSIKADEAIKIYSIGYETNSTESTTLKRIASGDDYFMEADANAIANKFEEVASSITNSAFAGTNATLTDNIGSNFTVTATSSEEVVAGEGNVSTTIDSITESGTKIAFEVEINGDEADGWVNVNEGFTLTYTDANGNPRTVTYGANEAQPQVYWERNTYNYVINYYKDEITDTSDTTHYLGTSGNISAHNGDVINLTDTEKNAFLSQAGEGYELSDSNIYTTTIDKTINNVINVLYEKIDLNYSIKYLFEDLNGNYVEDSNYPGNSAVSAKYGDEVSYTKHTLDTIPTGYELNTSMTEGNNNGTYTITDNNTTINIYYNRLNLTYKVKYYFQDLNGNYVELGNIPELTNQPAKYGKEVSYSEHSLNNVPEGYVPDTDKSMAVTDNKDGKYIIIDNNTTVGVYYKRSNYSFTVNYHFNGTPFDEVYTADAVYGATLHASDYIVENIDNTKIKNKYNEDDYFLDPTKTENSASITVGTDSNANVMDLYYITTFFEEDAEEVTKSSTTKEVTASDQVIDYTITYENTIKNVREGDTITVTVVDTLPFEIDTEKSNLKITDNNKEIEGVYDNSNKTITWTFTDTATAFTETYDITKTISFTVVYKDFANISASDNNNLVNTVVGTTTINNDSTPGTTSDSEEIPVKIEGNLVVYHYEKGTTTSVATKEEYTGLVGAPYADNTNYKTDIIGYAYDSVTGDENGNYIEGTKEVIYYYTRKNGEIEINEDTTNKVAKETVVDSINSTFKYTITGEATIKDYVGSYRVEATDNLPYKLDTTGMKELEGGKYQVNDKCIYDGNMTITCTSDAKTITGDMYDDNKEYHVNETFDLNIKYLDITEKTVSNNATIKVILDNNDKTSEEDSADVTVKEGNLTVIYRPEEGEVFETTTTTMLAGTPYTTSEKEYFGYHLKETPKNANGNYVGNSTVTVEYIYVLNDGEITENKVTKEGPEIINDVNDFTEYTIIYDGTIKDYIGKATLTITDTLPYPMGYSGFDYACDYNYEDNTFTCKVEYDITEEDYELNEDGEKVFNIHEEFHIDVIYGEIDSDIITNNAQSKLELREVYADSDSSVDSKVLEGELLVSYVDEEGNILNSYTVTDYAGSYYETEKEEFEGYTFKNSSDNTEGFLLANQTIYVEYVYSKNVGTYEELPPQTGIEDININYIKYLIMAFLFILFDKKSKEVKEN